MTDRRVQKTLAALHRSLIDLVLERGYEAISVGDILQRANVGRSTFYSHYSNKDALLQDGIDKLGKELGTLQRDAQRAQGEEAMPLSFSRALFDHAREYRAVYRAMLGQEAGAIVGERMRTMLRALVRRELRAMALPRQLAGVPPGALAEYLTGALMSTLTWWVDEDTEYLTEEVDTIFRKMALLWSDR